jgi:hypothetical protein
VCYFITGTLPVDTDVEAVRGISGIEGSAWRPLVNPHVRWQLPAGVDYYLVTGSVCDCDSALVRHLYALMRRRTTIPHRAARWSAAKLQRWREQRGFVEASREASVHGNISAWYRYLTELAGVVQTGAVGLLLHWYNGSIEDECFGVTVVNPVSIANVEVSWLTSWKADHLYQLAFKPRGSARNRPKA